MMKQIIFKKDNQDFVSELRTAVKGYFESNNIQKYGSYQILLKAMVMILVYFIPYGLLLSGNIDSLLPAMACWVMMGLGMSGVGLVAMHDANHGSFSKYRWVNKLFGNSLYLLGGFPPNWKYQHNTLHHGYTNIEGHDEDIAYDGILRFSPHRPLKKIHRFQHVYAWVLYGLMTLSWVTVKDFKRLKSYKDMGAVLNNNGNYKKLFLALILSKILYYSLFLGLPLLLVPIDWYWVLAGFFIMHFTSGFILTIIFQTAHVVPTSEYPIPNGNNELENNWAVHQLYTTCDFAPKNNLLTWLIGGLNFQVVHHLFPNISHVHYHKLAKIVQETAQKHQLPYHVNKTFIGALYQHMLMLKSLGKINPQMGYQ